MGEEPIARLAVARLDELSPTHRHLGGQPMHGFCLISGDGSRCRVTLYIENGRAPAGQAGPGSFYYEGWLVGPEGPVSLGAFNLGSGGQGSATREVEAASLHSSRSNLVRVTVEYSGGSEAGSIAVLGGRLVWLETDVTADAEPEETPAIALQAEAEPQVEPQDEPQIEVQPEVQPGVEVQPEPELAISVPEPVLEMAAVPAGSPEGASEPVPVATRPVAADPAPPTPEPRHANPLEINAQLVQRHPMAPRASGTAVINIRQGALTLMLRGLPSPTALGRDRSTDRPFNSYRVWLVNQATQVRTPAGFCERAWGDNFRFKADGLPLNRHDTLLVTVEDRTASGINSASPQVLIGSYAL